MTALDRLRMHWTFAVCDECVTSYQRVRREASPANYEVVYFDAD